MHQVEIHEAQGNLSELIKRAGEGEVIILAQGGMPPVRLLPVPADVGLRPIGLNALPADEVTEEFMAESMRPIKEGE